MTSTSPPSILTNVKKGDQVANLRRLAWGLGTVVAVSQSGVVEVLFPRENPSLKKLKLSVAQLISSKDFERLVSAEKPKQDVKKPKHPVRRKPGPIKLESKRGRRMVGRNRCHGCRRKVEGVYEYSKSNWGRVQICSKCKPEIMDYSFGKIDTQDVAEPGGGIETNRRKH